MHKMSLTLILLAAAAVGCAPQKSFNPETFEVGAGKLIAKGWTKDGTLHVEIRLEDDDENTTLTSVQLIGPDGTSFQPSKWTDETPRPFNVNLGLGIGIPFTDIGIGAGAGVDVPIKSGEKANRITAINVWWNQAGVALTPGSWTLIVDMKMFQMSGASRSRVRLKLKHAALAPGESSPKVREVDFTRQ